MKRRIPPLATDTAGYRSGRRPGKRKGFLPKAITLAVASCFAAEVAFANPNGFAVVNGQVVFNYNGNTLTITNTPGSIINWQAFSIAQNEITRFIQQSAASSILNRVIGIDPSIILGALQSNGRVFLINPNGILFGAGAQIDVAGLVASTLNLSNGDFLAGRLRFTDTPGAGSLVNQGAITTPSGGQVYLIAPNVQNTGIITSPQGEIILAAGRSVELVDAGTPGLRVEITAPDSEALNVGQIVANSGKIGIYAGLIRNSGIIKADGVVVGQNGEILLKATQNTTLDAGSIVSASGAQGGSVAIQSGDTTLVSGSVEAQGSAGTGGTVQLLGDRVGLIGNASVNASGQTGGGTILVGGDYQGKNPKVPNARRTYVGPNATLAANALGFGNGGKIIVWADEVTRVYGSIFARGGAEGGNGGFVETSGKEWLDFAATVDTSAPKGATGTLLLDPKNIDVNDTGGSVCCGGNSLFANNPTGTSVILASGAGSISEQTTNVLLQANNDITFTSAVNITNPGSTLTAQAGRSILVNANITTNNADVRLTANETVANGVVGANRDAGAATLSMAPGTTINAGATGNIYLRMNDGSGHANTSGNIVVENLNADNVSIIHDGLTANSSILRASGSSLLSANAVFMELENAAGASASIGTSAAPIRVSTPILEAHYHNASGGIFIDSPNPENLQIGGVPGLIFSGLVRGVQTVSGGPISITVNGNLSQLAGSAGCGLTGGTGGPICAGGGGSLALAVTGSDINLNSFVNAGTATLTATGDINVLNATVTTTGAMDVNATGNLNVTASTAATFLQSGGLQTINANGITMQGAASGSNLVAGITGNGGQNITVGSGGITLTGGAGGTNNGAFIQQFGALNDQTITVNGGGTVALTGGGGTQNYAQISNQGHAQAVNFTAGGALNLQGGSGANQNEAGIQNQGAGATTQTISFTGGGAINLTGGTVGQNNRAEIHAFTGNQTISGNPDITMIGGASGGAFDNENGANISLKTGATGVQTINANNISLTGGAGGSNNMAVISTETTGQTSNITTTGFVTLTGGAGTDALAAIGNDQSDTNITLNATGPVMLTGGSGGFLNYGAFAAIGAINGHSATVTVNSGGNVTLNSGGGPGAFAGIGSVGGSGTLNVSAGGNLALTGNAINPASIVTTGDITLSATNDITVRQNGLVIAGGDINVSGVNFNVGSAGATKNTTVTAGGDFTANLTGTLSVLGGNATFSCCDPVRDASAKLHANGIVDVTAARVNVAAGMARADGGEGATSARADAELSAGGNMFLTVGALGVNIAAGSAQAFAGPGENLTANANATLSAGGNLTMNIGPVVGTALFIGGGIAGATAQSGGGAIATAHADTTVSAGSGKDLQITVNGGDITIGGGNATARAFHWTSNSIGATLSGNNTATASADVMLSAGNNATITMNGGTLMVGGGNALASAYKRSIGSAWWYGSNALSGTNDATADANLTVKATSGNLTVNLGGAAMGVGSNLASAYAFHKVNGGGFNTLRDNNTATAAANISFTAGTIALNLGGGGLTVNGNQARAFAFHYASSSASRNALSGNNTATANSNISLAGGTITLNLGSGTMQVGANLASAAAYHSMYYADGFNTLSGDNTALATANINFTAGNALAINGTSASVLRVGVDASPSFFGQRPIAHTNAFKRVTGYYSSNVLSGVNQATANANLTFDAAGVGGLSVTVGDLQVRGGEVFAQAYHHADGGSMNTLSGNNTAIANSEVSFKASAPTGSLTIDLGSGSMTVTGPRTGLTSDATRAFKHVNDGQNHDLTSGDNTATALAEVKFTAGRDLTITAGSLVVNSGGGAVASADKTVTGFSANGNQFGGTNTTSSTANISFTAGNNLTIDLGIGGGSLSVNGARASGYAYHGVIGGSSEGGLANNTLRGDNRATANANTSFTAGGALTVNAGNVSINGNGSSVRALAFKQVIGTSFTAATNNTLSGSNTATANSNISLTGGSITLDLGSGNLSLNGNTAYAYARHTVEYGNNNNLGGDHEAKANSNIDICAGSIATGVCVGSGALTVNATGGVSIYGDDASAYATKRVGNSGGAWGNTNTLEGGNKATANSNISLGGKSLALNLVTGSGSGSLYISGNDAEAKARHRVFNGDGNILRGDHEATANSNISLTATSGPLTVNATGGVTIYGSSASARAYKYVSGSNNTLSGNNTASANSNISLSGVSVALNLGSGSLYISGSSASARAYHSAYGTMNNLSGNHVATANSNISLTATGGTLKVDATGGVTIYGSSASARAYKYVSGSSNTVSGNNTASANSNINFTGAAGLAFNLGAGSFGAFGSYARARAYHDVYGANNVLSGVHNATADARMTFTATSGDLTIDAGSFRVDADNYGGARAYMQASGSNNTVGVAGAASNTVSADSSIKFTAPNGKLTINVGSGSFTVNSSSLSASAYAYHQANGTGNRLTGNNTATNNTNVSFNAGNNLTISAGSMTVNASSIEATASAYKYATGNNHVLQGTNTATASANVSFTAGNDLTVNVGSGSMTLRYYSMSASAYAYHRVSGGDGNTLTGDNTATANGNIKFTAGRDLAVTAGSITVGSSSVSARASAYQQVSSGNNNTLTGNNTAANDATIQFTAGRNLTVNASSLTVTNYSISASAYAYKEVSSGNTNTLNGANSATANANVSFTAGNDLAVNLTGSLMAGNSAVSASAYAYHRVSTGTGNTLSGNNTATASGDLVFSAGNNLTIMAGSLTTNYNDAYASAYKQVCCAGADSNTLSGDNAATGSALIKFSAGTLNLSVGSLNVFGSYTSAFAANQIFSGNNNTLSGNNTAKALANVSFAAGALTIQANSVSIAASSASARASNNVAGTGNTVNGLNSALAQSNINLSGGALTIQANSLSIAAYSASAFASHNVAGTGNTVNAANDALAQSNVSLSGSTLTIQAPSLSVTASSGNARAYRGVSGSGNAVNGANTARAEGNLFLSGNTNVTIDVGAGNILVQGGYAGAVASSSVAVGNTVSGTSRATAHGNALIASGGDLAIAARDPVTLLLTLPGANNLTIQGGNANANTSGSGMNVANANANAGIFAVGTKTINVTGTVALIGGSISVPSASATPSAFAMLDPGSLDLTAFDLSLTPNGGGVVLSAFGGINLTLVALGGVPVPLDTFFGGLPPPPGVVAGQSTLTSINPIIVSVGGGSLNLTDLFGLPSGFLGLTLPPTDIIDVCSVAPEICAPLKFFTKRDDVLDPDKDKDKDKGKDDKKDEKQISKGLKAECD